MNIVYRRFHLIGVFAILGHFLSLTSKFSLLYLMIPRQKTKISTSIWLKVLLNLTVFTKQEQAAQFPIRQIGQLR